MYGCTYAIDYFSLLSVRYNGFHFTYENDNFYDQNHVVRLILAQTLFIVETDLIVSFC